MMFLPLVALLGALQSSAVPYPDRYPVWKWGGTAPRSFAYFLERGFTGGGSPMITGPVDPASKLAKDIQASLQQAEKVGFDYGLYLNPLMDPKWRTDPANRAEKFDGQKMPLPDPRSAAVVAYAEDTARSAVAAFAGSPALKQMLLGSEFQLDYNFSADSAKRALGEGGGDLRTAAIVAQPAANKPKNGLIDDDNPRYRYLKWWFHRGMGDATLNAAMARIVGSKRPDVLTWHDPYRLAPVSGSAEGLGAVSTWTYAQPDMTRLLYTRVLRAAARKDGQKIVQTITLFLYPRFVESVGGSAGSLENDKPGGSDFYTAGPDFAREATWMAFSQRPDAIAYYYGGALQPDDPNVDKNRASPETFDAIGGVVHQLVEPYGPTIRAGKPERAKVAVLMSAASIWLGEAPKNVGYPNEQILPYCSLLAMNHVPFEVILDDDVTGGRLSDYDVLVMPQAGAITRTMADRIRQFMASGGKVVADKALTPDLKGAVLTDYDFTFQRQVDGVELSKGNAITAEENRARMEAYAADLKAKFPGLNVTATTDSPRAIVNVVESGPIKYVFVVNDNRGYGPRFGAAKLHMEKGLPLSTKLTINSRGTIYDALEGTKASANGTVQLTAAGGKLLVVLPSDPPDPTVSVASHVIIAKAGPAQGSYPVRFEVLDDSGKTRLNWCLATKNGTAQAPFPTGESGTYTVKVTDLVTHKTATASVTQ